MGAGRSPDRSPAPPTANTGMTRKSVTVAPSTNGVPMSDDTDDGAVLDAYSTVVSNVAATVGPSVAAVTMADAESRPRGAGSAVIFTGDGFLLTNAHVVGAYSRGTAKFT